MLPSCRSMSHWPSRPASTVRVGRLRAAAVGSPGRAASPLRHRPGRRGAGIPVTYTRRPLPLAPGAGPGPVADEAAYESPGSFSGGCANRQPPRAPPEGLGAARALTTAKIMTHLAGGGGRGGARPWRGRRRGTGRRGRAGPAGPGVCVRHGEKGRGSDTASPAGPARTKPFDTTPQTPGGTGIPASSIRDCRLEALT